MAQAGGSFLIEHSIHDVDILRFCFGEVGEGHRTGALEPRPVMKGLRTWRAVSLSFVSGLEAHLTSVWHDILSRGSTRGVEVFCRQAMVWLEDEFRGPLHVQTSAGLGGAGVPVTSNGSMACR